MPKRFLWSVVLLVPIVAAAVAVPLLAAPEVQKSAAAVVSPEVMRWGFLAAVIASGVSALGAAYAVAVVGAAAMGAVAEKPETAGRALVFVGLAEGIAIYGLIIAIMILGRLG
jgi:V/A-type H+-transporting ATPase subunit K